jgi:hypothetical protein
MIENKLNNGTGYIIFNEPYDDYYDMILHAATCNHRLAKNYRANLLDRMEYMAIYYRNHEPEIMFGTENYMDNLYRGFSRYYHKPKIHKINYDNYTHVLDFYKDDNNIIFVTKNTEGKPMKAYTNAMAKHGFKKLNGIRVYKDTPQYIFINDHTSEFENEFPRIKS